MKSQEQRIEDATAAFLDHTQDWYRGHFDSTKVSRDHWQWAIARALEAADAPPKPKWPTDESITAFLQVGSSWRERTRAAMLHDPIIKAAIALRDAYLGDKSFDGEIGRVYDAVNEAGL